MRYATDAQELYINLSKWDVKAYTQTYVGNLKHITSTCANIRLHNVHERKHVLTHISADVRMYSVRPAVGIKICGNTDMLCVDTVSSSS
jgi:hypothetical protein